MPASRLARWPNTGYARNTQASGTTLQSNSITQASGFFTGARAVVRVTASSVDTLRITGHSGTTLTFGSTPSNSNMGNQDWGFYIENKLNLLDAPGEWFYESSSGQLYLWAPGGVNPTTLTVEASTFWAGVECYWQRQYLTIQDLHFRKSRNAGVRQDGANYVTVNNCILERSFHGIRSYGTYDVYTNNIIRRTYATGALIIDNNTLFANNQVTNVATRIGLGEHSWGYFGVRSIGSGNIIRANRLDSVGYTAIEANSNALVEKNVITRYNFCLNDGGGINFDNSNGIIIQDNLIRDAIGGWTLRRRTCRAPTCTSPWASTSATPATCPPPCSATPS
ncbi:MAG: right-handed parallel beta-helix repeat-containing protein [Flavobacteriales bacterium]